MYKNMPKEGIDLIGLCIQNGQFVYEEEKYFACYWKVDDVPGILSFQKPEDITRGSFMYVMEFAVNGKENVLKATRALKQAAQGMNGIFWHKSNNKGFRGIYRRF